MTGSEYNSDAYRSRNYNQPNKPNRKCPYGFTCRNHSWGRYKYTKDCKYYATCKRTVKKIMGASLDHIEKYVEVWRQESRDLSRRYPKPYPDYYDKYYGDMAELFSAIEKHERAVIFLRQRGNHQSLESLGVKEQLSQVKKLLNQLGKKLKNLDRGYIAPEKVYIETSNTKYYPDGKSSEENPLPNEEQTVYEYYRLKSKTAQFECEREPDQKCTVIQLGKSDSEKYIQGRLGIERRKRLIKISSKLVKAAKILREAAELADAELNHDDLAGDAEGDS